MDKNINLSITQINRTIWRIFLFLLSMAFLLIAFPYLKPIIFMLIISWILAIILNPIVDYGESVGINRALAIVIVMVLIVGGIAGIVALIVPAIMNAIDTLSGKMQSDFLKDLTAQLEAFFQKNFNNAALARDVIAKVNDLSANLLSNMGQFLQNASSFVAFIGIIPFVTFFLIKDLRFFKRLIIQQVPNKYFELALNILHKVGDQVTRYIQGQAIDALIVGILSVIGLGIINIVFGGPVPYFFFIGMMAGIANLIPYLGPLVGAIPAVVLTIMHGPQNLGTIVVWIAVVFALVQGIDNNIVSPMVVSKSVNMHPITVVIAVILGGNIAGVIGMLFAVPAWGIIKVVMKEVSWGLKSYKLR